MKIKIPFLPWSGKAELEIEIPDDTDECVHLSTALGIAVGDKADLTAANLRYADLRSADLSGAKLRYANLEGADLAGVDLSYADLAAGNLSDSKLSYADLSGADLRAVCLRAAKLIHANLRDADLSGANLSYSDLSDADLSGANLRYVDLSDAHLHATKLVATNWRNAGDRRPISAARTPERLNSKPFLIPFPAPKLASHEKRRASGRTR